LLIIEKLKGEMLMLICSSKNIFLLCSVVLTMLVVPVNAVPKRVIILRHGEKEPVCGNLSPRGVLRSLALAQFFTNNPPILCNRIPKAFFACEPRTIQTITPTAESFPQTRNIPFQHVNDYFALPDVDRPRLVQVTQQVSREILNNQKYTNKILVVCWEHRNIPLLAHLLGALQAPDVWPDESFDMFWVITYNCGSVDFKMLPQNLLPGDITVITLQSTFTSALIAKYCAEQS
jgi:hypothetical protein